MIPLAIPTSSHLARCSLLRRLGPRLLQGPAAPPSQAQGADCEMLISAAPEDFTVKFWGVR